MTKRIQMIIALAAFLLFAAPAALCAAPSYVAEHGDTADWIVGETLIWRFPIANAHTARDASERFNLIYSRGFRIEALAVKKIGGAWTLCVGEAQLLAAEHQYARGSGMKDKEIGVTWLSRLYDALGTAHAGPLTNAHKLKGGHKITSKISWYGGKFIGSKCSSGEILTETSMTAAAKSLPFGTLVRVTVPRTKRTVVVRITDRFAEHKGRAIDISSAAAELLGIKGMGIAQAEITVIGKTDKIGGVK